MTQFLEGPTLLALMNVCAIKMALRRCYWGIFNFQTMKIWEIDLLYTCYIHADFQACRICRTAELEVSIPIFFALLLQTTF